MRSSLLPLAIVVILGVVQFGCTTQPYRLAKKTAVPNELKGGKSVSVRLFTGPRVLIYDAEPVENLRRYLAGQLAALMIDLDAFSDIRVLSYREEPSTDLVLEGEFTVVDQGRRESMLEALGGVSKDLTTRAFLAVNVRILKVRNSFVVYEPKEIKVGRFDSLGYRCLLCASIPTIMRRLIDELAQRITDDLKAELR